MQYIFEMKIYTDDDFTFPYIPRDMDYDNSSEYHLRKVYGDRNQAIENILDICNFLKEQIYSSRDYVLEEFNNCVNRFIEKLKNSRESFDEHIFEYSYGNREIEINFNVKLNLVNVGIEVTDEELAMIERNNHRVTYEMYREAILNLFKDPVDVEE